jgi:hypothetical protein
MDITTKEIYKKSKKAFGICVFFRGVRFSTLFPLLREHDFPIFISHLLGKNIYLLINSIGTNSEITSYRFSCGLSV